MEGLPRGAALRRFRACRPERTKENDLDHICAPVRALPSAAVPARLCKRNTRAVGRFNLTAERRRKEDDPKRTDRGDGARASSWPGIRHGIGADAAGAGLAKHAGGAVGGAPRGYYPSTEGLGA